MKNASKLVVVVALLAVSVFAQDKQDAQRGFIDFGARAIWGDVYGRPDLPFSPSLKNSKLNEYRDLRDGIFVRKAYLDFEDVAGSKTYITFQTNNSIYRDQSYLATWGEWGRFKLSLRYDQIPHRYSDTTRTIYSQVAPGVWTIPTLTRTALFNVATSNVGCATTTTFGCQLPQTIQNQIVPQMSFIVPQIDRRAGSIALDYSLTPDWTIFARFWREHESGTRPIGFIFNSSPSAAINGGFGAEVPESINYFNNLVTLGTEFDRDRWAARFTYKGSFFENNLTSLTVDNPFRTTDCVAPATGAPATCNSSTQGPARGQLAEYPDNSAQTLTAEGAVNLGHKTRLMAHISPGWQRQNQAFLPITANTALLSLASPLPSSSLHGDVQTLAMNYTLASKVTKNFEVRALYRQFDYNNNTPSYTITEVLGDIAAPAADSNDELSFFRKNLDITGNYFFGKRSSAKLGYTAEWMDRTHRDVSHTMENGLIASVDLEPNRIVGLQLSYRHAVRNGDDWDDDNATTISGGIPVDSPFLRRFDEADRQRDKVDAVLTFDPTDRMSFSAFASTNQDNFNRPGGINSTTPLNFLSGTYPSYYLYGLLKDLSYLYGTDGTITLTNAASFFYEYSHERYYKSMASRYRVPFGSGTALLPSNCGLSTAPCDSSNNDWASYARDVVDVVTVGFDVTPGKRASFSTYYSLSAGKTNMVSAPLGDTTLLAAGATNPNRFMLTGTNAAVPYPQTTNRLHELGATFKYKINQHIQPKFEYRLQQWDNKDYQTSPMTPYMGCVSGVPPSAPIPGCTTPILTTSTAFPSGSPSSFYPYFVVGDPSAARYLFMGVDQPSYRTHYISATVEIHF